MNPLAQSAQPARALYKMWDRILTFAGRESMPYGEPGWRLMRQGADIIAFGQGHYAHFLLHRTGRFQINHMWGYYRRNCIQRNVPFLKWGYTHSRYQWYATLGKDESYRYGFFTDWTKPVHYVSEDVLGCRLWNQTPVWCVLKKQGEQWTIQPARDQTSPANHFGLNEQLQHQRPSVRKRWRHYETIVQKRYERARRADQGDPPVSHPAPTMRRGNQPIPTEQAVEHLVALLEVSRPAKTTPLKKKPKEATDGNHLATPQHV